jgi:hypothetical protein
MGKIITMLSLAGIRDRFITVSSDIEKRIRFVFSALALSVLMLIATFFFFDKAIFFVPLFILVTYFLTFFSVLQGVEKAEWLTLFLMPVIFTIAFYLFFLLFPVRWLTRVPFIMIYAFSLYAILLTSNIFNVGVEKSLQLYRAAFSVNYFYQTLVVFLVSNVVFSFRLNPLVNGGIMFVIIFLLGLQLLWSVNLKTSIDRQIVHYSLLISFLLVQITIVLSFLPLKLSVIALFITAAYYSLCGLLYHYIEQKLFTQTVREYIVVLGFVLAILILSIQW